LESELLGLPWTSVSVMCGKHIAWYIALVNLLFFSHNRPWLMTRVVNFVYKGIVINII